MSVTTLSRSALNRACIESSTPPITAESRLWPRDWPSQRLLLERQHSRLEVMLNTLIALARSPGAPERAGETHAEQRSCRRLQRALRLHLHLEERWLTDHGCLDAGHKASHRLARTAAQQADAILATTLLDRAIHLHWLQGLQEWFLTHRDGIDAIAYSRADHSCHQPQP